VDFFPLFAKLKGRACLVVGGGEVAARKTQMLLRAGARVIVNAPEVEQQLASLAEGGRIIWEQCQFDASLIDRVFLVVAATDNRMINRAVSEAADRRHRLVNVVDEGELCSYISPAVVDRSPLVMADSRAIGSLVTGPIGSPGPVGRPHA
jgi:uroporphyrin-III C-methyltransferase/precorrin-2 dehydrogenase/sirohydrochlorin ferrochelatase